jgi:leucyl aminopeptidase
VRHRRFHALQPARVAALCAAVSLLWPTAAPALDVIDAMVERVDADSVTNNVISLEGFVTRRADTAGGLRAAEWIGNRFLGFGVDSVFAQKWSVAYAPNVIGIVRGAVRPHRIVLVGGHFDSITASFTSAPGADDNASGTSCVLECARVLAHQHCEFTLEFAAFSAEELGLVGSNAYAAHLTSTGDTLVAMINVDMIGYLADRDTRDLDLITNAGSRWLFDLCQQTTRQYVPTLPTVEGAYLRGTSDNAAFWAHGFSAVSFFEDTDQPSPYIHTGEDTYLGSFNDPLLASSATRAAVALLATLARPAGVAVTVEDFVAQPTTNGVDVAWHLASGATANLRGVDVQSAVSDAGPFTTLTTAPLAPERRMHFLDHRTPAEAPWYRLELIGNAGAREWTGAIAAGRAAAVARTWLRAPIDRGEAGIAVEYDLAPGGASASVAVFDAVGRRIRGLESGAREPGVHLQLWDRRDDGGGRVARGVYFVQLRSGPVAMARKILVAR